MLSEKIDPNLMNNIESIVDWFDHRKQSFYTLGKSFVTSEREVEELFYHTIIKVEKDLPRFNRKTSFEMWITSIFIHKAREHSYRRNRQVSEKKDVQPVLFKWLNKLGELEKEALILTYVSRISHKETADFLQVSVGKLKELLFSGIQKLRKFRYGETFNGCKEYHSNYIDYLDKTMERSKKIDFEIHLFHCEDCQKDLGSFQDMVLQFNEKVEKVHVPTGFMDNVKERIANREKRKQERNKKYKRAGLVATSITAMLVVIGYFSGFFTKIYYTWTEEDLQLRTLLQNGLVEKINLEAEDNGVKITIKSIIADDVQTLIFYEIENDEQDLFYRLDYSGIYIQNEARIMDVHSSSRGYSTYPLKNENVNQGVVSLHSLKSDEEVIKLTIWQLQKWTSDPSTKDEFWVYENMEFEKGEWKFEIPITKRSSTEYVLDEEIEIEGIPVRLDKLIIAPTGTVLHAAHVDQLEEKRVTGLNIASLKVNDKVVKPNFHSRHIIEIDDNWYPFQVYFEPILEETPKELTIQFDYANLSAYEGKTIDLEPYGEYPQTFDYIGTTISIDKIEVGQPTQVVISNVEVKDRPYLWFFFGFVDEDDDTISYFASDTESILLDKYGNEYDLDEDPLIYEEIMQAHTFITKQNLELHSHIAKEKVVPKRMEIYGNYTVKYLDDVVKISLELT